MKGNEFSKSLFITAGSGTFGLYVYSCCMNYILVNSPFTYRSRHVSPNHVTMVERAMRTTKRIAAPHVNILLAVGERTVKKVGFTPSPVLKLYYGIQGV